jgi:protein SCO1/2
MVTPRIRCTIASIAAGIVMAGCSADDTPRSSTSATPQPALHGVVPGGHVARPAFALRDTAGHRYDFNAETAGRVTLLYAGYTHCPDECPTTMADIASALRRLPRAVADQVKVVFITTDPWRDDRRVIRHWLDGFHPPTPYVGLTGTPSRLANVETKLGMGVAQRQDAPKSFGSGDYAVDHFDGLLLYGPDDRLLTIYPADSKPKDIASDIRQLVSSK